MTAPGQEARALGPVVLTATELGLLEEAHRRLLAGLDHDGPGEDAPTPEASGTAEDPGTREARRSLVARGLLAPDGSLPEEDDLGLLVSTLLDVRLASEVVLAAERVTALPEDDPQGDPAARPSVARGTRLVHVSGPAACVEDLLPGEAHHLHLLLEREDVAAWLSGATVPADALPASGPPVAVDPARPERLAALLGHPTVLAELAVLRTPTSSARAARRAHHLLALGPAGCWQAELDPGRPLPPEVVLHPVHPGWVGEWAAAVLGARPPAAAEGEHREQGTMSG